MRRWFAKTDRHAETPAHFTAMCLRLPTAIFYAMLAVAASARAEELISIRGAQVAAEAVTAAAGRIKKDVGLEFRVTTDGGSGGAIFGIGEDVVDLALLSRKITQRERAAWPDMRFSEVQFGTQVLLIIVPERVWKSGVHALTREQLRGIYEGRTKNWKALGGEDRAIVFFNRDVRSSASELLLTFLYEDARKAPPSDAEAPSDPNDVMTAVEYNGASISVLESGLPRAASIRVLGIRQADGSVVEPTPENIVSGRYELARPLIIATPRKPAGRVRRFVEFMLGAEGQAFVKKVGHVTTAELAEKN